MTVITPKFKYIKGSFDTESVRLISVAREKHATVDLCFQANMNIAFAEIKIFSGNKFVDAKEVFNDAAMLGEEIAARWNNHAPRSLKEIRSDFEAWFADDMNSYFQGLELTASDIAEWREGNSYDCMSDYFDNSTLCGAWAGWQAANKRALDMIPF